MYEIPYSLDPNGYRVGFYFLYFTASLLLHITGLAAVLKWIKHQPFICITGYLISTLYLTEWTMAFRGYNLKPFDADATDWYIAIGCYLVFYNLAAVMGYLTFFAPRSK